MPRFLALDGESARIQVVSATLRGSNVRLEKSVTWDESQPISAANAEAAGRNLREQLKQAGIAPAPLFVCVGRERVVVKDVRIPVVPPHEEPALVRFQALKELTDADELSFDYTSAGPGRSASERRLYVVAIRKDLLSAFKTLAEAAGLKLVGVTPRPFATIAGLRSAAAAGQVPPLPGDGAAALLVRGDKWGEFSVVHAGVLMQARSLAGPAASNEAALLGEIRRNLAIHANQNPDAPVKAIYLAEPDSPGGLRERMQSALGMPVHAFEPLVGLSVLDGPQGGLAGPAGLLALKAESAALPINFTQPRQPKPPRDPGKSMLAIVGIAAAVLLILGGVYGYLMLSSKSALLAQKQRDKNALDDNLRMIDPDLKRLKALDDWAATDVNWLDELYDMTARVPDVNKIRVLQFQGTQLATVDPAGKNKHVGALKITGIRTSDHTPLDKLMSELHQESAFYSAPLLDSKENRLSAGPERFTYPVQFTIHFEVLKRQTDRYSRTFVAKAPPKKPKPGEMGDMGNFDFGGIP